MAIILHKVCDKHYLNDEQVEGDTMPPITLLNGKPKLIDLCDDCQKEIRYMELLDLATEVGRDLDFEEPRRRSRKSPEDVEAKVRCYYCTRKFASVQGRTMHITRSHSAQLAKLTPEDVTELMAENGWKRNSLGDVVPLDDSVEETPATGDIFYCEPCDRSFDSHNALNGHKTSRAHKENEANFADAH